MIADDHLKGLLITGAGVLIITPDTLLVRLVETDEWTLLFWRGLLSGVAILAGLAAVHRTRLPAHARAIGAAGLWLAGLFTIGSVLFIVSLTHTTVANSLFIVSAEPFFAAIFAHLFLRERVERPTWVAIGFALVGIGIIAAGSASDGAGSLAGDLAALGVAVTLAGAVTITRHGRARSMVPAIALSAFLTALVVAPFAAPLSVSAADVVWLGLMGLIVIPMAFTLLTIGPRYLPGPEVGLLMLLEAVVGPYWVWLALGEEPGKAAITGGSVVIATVVALNLYWLAGRRA